MYLPAALFSTATLSYASLSQNISITILLSLLFIGHLVGMGVGTILAMIGVGRTIAVFNHFTHAKMKELAAVEE